METIRHLRVTRKYWETADAATFELEPEDGAPLDYQPGQYLSVIRNILGREQRRAYSFSSCPGVDARAAITVKRIPNGEFSNWLLHQVAPGDILTTGEPAGLFTLPDTLPQHMVYLAGGSGITPMISHLKALFASSQTVHRPPSTVYRKKPSTVNLIYANRNAASTMFKTQLDQWMADFPDQFHCTYVFSREKHVGHARFGHLSNRLFEELVQSVFGKKITPRDRRSTLFYLCAPKAVMRMAEMVLHVLDVPAANIRGETFVADTRLPKRVPDPSRTHSIGATGKDGQRIEFQVLEGETILNGALRQGIPLPYTCKSGVCFTCLARCTQGVVDVEFVEQTRRETAGALVNTCIGYAVSGEVELVYE